MKRAILILALLLPVPALAEEDGVLLMERGAQMLMEGLLQEMEPALDGLQGMAEEFGPALRDFTSQMGPALRELLTEVEDWSVYHPPEVLENGDIVIRRRVPADEVSPKKPDAQVDI